MPRTVKVPARAAKTRKAPQGPPIPDELRPILRQLDLWVEQGLLALGDHKDGEPIRELHLELTYRCNLKCIMCHHWEMPFKDPASVKREMDLGAIRALVAGSKLLDGVRQIVLSGGEPMLRADFDDIVACLAERFPEADITILANFWNTELVRRRVVALRERGVKRFFLGSSLDGVGEAHDRIRGQKGAFEGLVKTVEMLRRDFPDIGFSFSLTVTPKNHEQLWPTYEFVAGLGVGFGAQIVVNHQGYEAPETFEWKRKELDEVAVQIDRILLDIARREKAMERIVTGKEGESRWLWDRLLYWWYLRKYALKPERFFKDCMAGQRFAMVDPEGNLFYCPVNKHRQIGNVREKGLDALWRSKKADDERAFVDSCQCDCWLNCIANPILERLTSKALGNGSR